MNKFLILILLNISLQVHAQNIAPTTYFASPGSLGSNAFYSFFMPINDLRPSNSVKLETFESYDQTKNNDKTLTSSFSLEYPVGTKDKKFASFQVEGLFEKYKFNQKTVQDWNLENTHGNECGDLNFRAKLYLIDKSDYAVLVNILMKTTAGKDENRRFSDTAGGSGYFSGLYKFFENQNFELFAMGLAGFGGWDDNNTGVSDPNQDGGSTKTSQNDVFHYGLATQLKTKDKQVEATAGVMGIQGWRNNGDRYKVPYLDLRYNLNNTWQIFQRTSASIDHGVQNIRIGAGAAVNIDSVKLIRNKNKLKTLNNKQAVSVISLN